MAPSPEEQVLLTAGSLFIGTFLNWGLLGTLTVQVYLYHNSKYKDAKWIKYLVGSIFIIDVVQTIFATHCIWGIVILGWGDITILTRLPWTAYTFPIMSGVVGGMVQTFFAWRIWILTNGLIGKLTAGLIVMTALGQVLSGSISAIKSAFISILDIHSLFLGFTVWLVGSLVCDLLIAGSMLVILHSSRTRFEPTGSIIDRLMIRAVHSGAITAVAALIQLILFLALRDTFLFDCPAVFLGKLYSNVLLANLNGRRKNDTTYSSVDHLSFPGNIQLSAVRVDDRIPIGERTVVMNNHGNNKSKMDSFNGMMDKRAEF
ncbi:hypothetical protein BDZ94DRAFT_1317821 [Collybia nuda]|uniref:DUF6534 domain-containing protein n=1 Tax=Collybia nuda TaxID=64659 RepID=A0A9P5YHD3_9AGAR|nr:hypothetical protein BDZ94DRAFT_1317821 [Collybia nuda]